MGKASEYVGWERRLAVGVEEGEREVEAEILGAVEVLDADDVAVNDDDVAVDVAVAVVGDEELVGGLEPAVEALGTPPRSSGSWRRAPRGRQHLRKKKGVRSFEDRIFQREKEIRTLARPLERQQGGGHEDDAPRVYDSEVGELRPGALQEIHGVIVYD